MALALIAYFCTMVSALAVLMVLLSSVISPQHLRQPHSIAPTKQMAALESKAALPITTVVQAAPDSPTPMKKTKTNSRKPGGTKWTRRQKHYRNRLPQQEPNGFEYSTALAFQQEYFGVIDRRRNNQRNHFH